MEKLACDSERCWDSFWLFTDGNRSIFDVLVVLCLCNKQPTRTYSIKDSSQLLSSSFRSGLHTQLLTHTKAANQNLIAKFVVTWMCLVSVTSCSIFQFLSNLCPLKCDAIKPGQRFRSICITNVNPKSFLLRRSFVPEFKTNTKSAAIAAQIMQHRLKLNKPKHPRGSALLYLVANN